jgi:3-hydroxyacyl-[acyl-carrier-protein] dehydratase|tara:strand:+ start:11755 stop:12225 length:471 start_codon:yes stop_codon:yes gene_type:complete
MKLAYKDILEHQQNRSPYLMIDGATSVIPGKSSNAYKQLSEDEWFFEVHWPGDPNMPGMLQIESLVQTASLSILTLPNNKGKIMYLVSADKMKFIKKIIPGDRLELETKVLTWKRGMGKFQGSGFVNGKIVCKGSFTLILPDEIQSYSIKGKKKLL